MKPATRSTDWLYTAMWLALGLAFVALVLGMASASPAQAQGPGGAPGAMLRNPPGYPAARAKAPTVAVPAGAKKVVVLKSWEACAGLPVWDDLNVNWSNFGTTPISIDYSNPALCEGTITYDALVASGADTLVISDPSGGSQQYSADEVSAIKQYLLLGHNLVGTYLVLYWGGGVDNRVLAPLFGLDPNATYAGGDNTIDETYNEMNPSLFLWKNVGNPYVSGGYASSQTPADGTWDSGENGKAKYLATNSDRSSVVMGFMPKRTFKHASAYITSMPEYNGNTADEQFLYNAISH